MTTFERFRLFALFYVGLMRLYCRRSVQVAGIITLVTLLVVGMPRFHQDAHADVALQHALAGTLESERRG